MTADIVNVLLVEDDDIDREALERAFDEAGLRNPLHHARDGVEALSMLRGGDGREPIPRPYLILLDLNLPRMSGLEFLAALRAEPALADSVVFVLTTSRRDEDRQGAYRHNVAGYISKATVGTQFDRVAGLMDAYWRLVDLPQ